MPEVQEGWARNKELQTGKQAIGLPGQPEVVTPIKGCIKGDDKGTGHQIKYRGLLEIYVLCNELRTGLGNALVDTGSQVSLVKEIGLIRGSNIRRDVSRIQGITVDFMEIKGQTKLSTGDTSPHEFLVMDKLPMNYDLLFGQDWLEKFGFNLQKPSLGITLPAYSETLVRIPTGEKGNRLVEAQELQENMFCASSVVECVDISFLCLSVNLNSTEQTPKLSPDPRITQTERAVPKCGTV
jgi:hypothetical protein